MRLVAVRRGALISPQTIVFHHARWSAGLTLCGRDTRLNVNVTAARLPMEAIRLDIAIRIARECRTCRKVRIRESQVFEFIDIPVINGVATLPDGRSLQSAAQVIRVPMNLPSEAAAAIVPRKRRSAQSPREPVSDAATSSTDAAATAVPAELTVTALRAAKSTAPASTSVTVGRPSWRTSPASDGPVPATDVQHIRPET